MTNIDIYAREENNLKAIFSSYWEDLSEYSKKSLISAMIMYNQVKDLDCRDMLEYSGIFILITKVLEIEYSRLFYYGLIDYLDNNYYDVSEYPSFLKYYAKNGNTYVQKEEYITLGSYPYIFGNKVGERDTDEYNYDNIIIKNYIEDMRCANSNNSTDTLCKCMGEMAELMTVKRNPSAHKGSISFKLVSFVIEALITKRAFLKTIMENFYEAKYQ